MNRINKGGAVCGSKVHFVIFCLFEFVEQMGGTASFFLFG